MWGIAGVFLGAAGGCTAAQPPFSHPHIPAARGNERRNRARKLARLEALPRPIFASLFLGCSFLIPLSVAMLLSMGYGLSSIWLAMDYGLWGYGGLQSGVVLGD